MAYAITTPDGQQIYKVFEIPLPDGSTDYARYGVLPVEKEIPDGFKQNGWQIVDGVCKPILVEKEPTVEPHPFEVGAGQIRAALIALGWVEITNLTNPDADLDTWALGLISNIPDQSQRLIATVLWHNAGGFKFDNEFIVFAAGVLGKTEEERKQLFRIAATF